MELVRAITVFGLLGVCFALPADATTTSYRVDGNICVPTGTSTTLSGSASQGAAMTVPTGGTTAEVACPLPIGQTTSDLLDVLTAGLFVSWRGRITGSAEDVDVRLYAHPISGSTFCECDLDSFVNSSGDLSSTLEFDGAGDGGNCDNVGCAGGFDPTNTSSLNVLVDLYGNVTGSSTLYMKAMAVVH